MSHDMEIAMTQEDQTLKTAFRAAAEKVSAVVVEIKNMDEALTYAVALCERKEDSQPIIPISSPLHPVPAGNPGNQRRSRVLAAPQLPEEQTCALKALCKQNGIDFARENLRDHLDSPAGIDVGLTLADFGIAETGTLVIDSSSEQIRLATMISEVHVAVLPTHRIRASAFELEDELRQMMMEANPNYTAFITGASRTADIERVLAIGVHGPLELHILLLEEN